MGAFPSFCRSGGFRIVWRSCATPAVRNDVPLGFWGKPSDSDPATNVIAGLFAYAVCKKNPQSTIPSFPSLCRSGGFRIVWRSCATPAVRNDVPLGFWGKPSDSDPATNVIAGLFAYVVCKKNPQSTIPSFPSLFAGVVDSGSSGEAAQRQPSGMTFRWVFGESFLTPRRLSFQKFLLTAQRSLFRFNHIKSGA